MNDPPADPSAWVLVIFAVFGALVLYLLNRLHSKQPFSLFKAININVSDSGNWSTILLDMLISSGIGGVAVYFLTSPTTIPQAIVAGLGMTGLLSVRAVPEGGEVNG